ncbi:MAG: phosphatidylserine/phosphatidylglycerophosphate/cardiolipin synthase family protein [Bdellovibrionales bacterium]|nr:phosphatidylserine/phosphatidylglycerophosphate/cardiolipin synthase family protein [Bdellovibrionales bacterium]
MIRLTLILAILISSQGTWGACTSSLSNKIFRTVTQQKYTPGDDESLTQANRIRDKVYLRSREIFGEMSNLIGSAQDHVYVQTWRFDHDSQAAQYLARGIQKLTKNRQAQRAKRPVDFWLMVNVIATQSKREEIRKIEQYVSKYGLDNRYVRFHLGIFSADFLGANHAKSLVIDSQTAMVTGANLTNAFNGLGHFDVGFVVEGEAAQDLAKDFVQIWRSYVKNSESPKERSQLFKGSATGSCLPILFARKRPFSQMTKSTWSNSLNHSFLAAARSAKKSIDIITPSLNVREFKDVIKDAVKRGVKIRIVVDYAYEAFKQNIATRGGDNLSNIRSLYRSLGPYASRKYLCKVFPIRWYSENGKKRVRGTAGNSHAKFMIVDNQITYTGSANMDVQSWVNSREIGLFIDSSSKAKKWKRSIFEPVFKRAIAIEECGGPKEPNSDFNERDRGGR